MTTKMSETIKVWIKQCDVALKGSTFYILPESALPILESKIADLLSNNCPKGGCHSSIFDEE